MPVFSPPACAGNGSGDPFFKLTHISPQIALEIEPSTLQRKASSKMTAEVSYFSCVSGDQAAESQTNLEIVTDAWKTTHNDDSILNVKEKRPLGAFRGKTSVPQAPQILLRLASRVSSSLKDAPPGGMLGVRAQLWDYGPAPNTKKRSSWNSSPQSKKTIKGGAPFERLFNGLPIAVEDSMATFGSPDNEGYRYSSLRCIISRAARIPCKQRIIAFRLQLAWLRQNEATDGLEFIDYVDKVPSIRSRRMSISEKAMCPRVCDIRPKSKGSKEQYQEVVQLQQHDNIGWKPYPDKWHSSKSESDSKQSGHPGEFVPTVNGIARNAASPRALQFRHQTVQQNDQTEKFEQVHYYHQHDYNVRAENADKLDAALASPELRVSPEDLSKFDYPGPFSMHNFTNAELNVKQELAPDPMQISPLPAYSSPTGIGMEPVHRMRKATSSGFSSGSITYGQQPIYIDGQYAYTRNHGWEYAQNQPALYNMPSDVLQKKGKRPRAPSLVSPGPDSAIVSQADTKKEGYPPKRMSKAQKRRAAALAADAVA